MLFAQIIGIVKLLLSKKAHDHDCRNTIIKNVYLHNTDAYFPL